MKYLLVFILIFFLVLSNNGNAERNSAVDINNKMIEAKLVYIFKDKSKTAVKVASFKLYPGTMSEVHSTKDHSLPGGFWNLELRMLDEDKFQYTYWRSEGVSGGEFWLEKGRKHEREVIIDISAPRSFSTSFSDKEGTLILDILPNIATKNLASIELSDDSFSLRSLCFNQSAVVIDESFYLGMFNGFGERLTLGIPSLSVVSLSLKPMRDWKPIGEFKNGTITIDLKNGHLLNIFNVGIGASGFKKGGPFIIYGEKLNPVKTRQEAIEFSLKHQQRHLSQERKIAFEQAIKTNPFVGLSTGTIGNDEGDKIYSYIENAIGGFFDGQECGS